MQKGRVIRIALGVLQLIVGVGAVPAGVMFIASPQGWPDVLPPLSILENSPFKDFLIPGILLLVVNGLGSLFGAYLTLSRRHYAGLLAMALGLFLIGWISAQVYWFETINSLHIIFFTCGVVEFGLGIVHKR
jgi:hypothetical protein